MKLAFIAVNYNNCYISVNYISNILSIRNLYEHDYEIIIVDNCSDNEDFQKLKSAISDLTHTTLLRSESNLGYFGGLNFGIRQINYMIFDYIIAGNNDLFFDRDFINILKEKKYDMKQTVIVPDLVTLNGIHQNPQFIHVPSKKRQLSYMVYYSCYPVAVLINVFYGFIRAKRTDQKRHRLNRQTEIFQCTGALMLFRPIFFNHCGLLDESLFLWGEEVALAHQLVLVGDKMLYDPDLRVIHIENSTVGKITSYKKFKIWKKSYSVYKNYYYE